MKTRKYFHRIRKPVVGIAGCRFIFLAYLGHRTYTIYLWIIVTCLSSIQNCRRLKMGENTFILYRESLIKLNLLTINLSAPKLRKFPLFPPNILETKSPDLQHI